MNQVDVDDERKRIDGECKKAVDTIRSVMVSVTDVESLVAADLDKVLLAGADLCQLKIEAEALLAPPDEQSGSPGDQPHEQ